MTTIESLPSASMRAITELSAAAVAKFRTAILPIYGSTPRGIPIHIGTAIALDWNLQKLLLTAAHVIDNNELSSLYVGGADLTLLEMNFLTSSKSGQDRIHDHYDFAIGRIPPQTLKALDGISFISESDICTASHEPAGTTYTIVGYPNSKNKKTNATKRLVYTEQAHYSDVARTNQTLSQELNLSHTTHIFMNYNAKHSRDAQGQRVNSIQLKGMSGGPVFNIGVLPDPSVLGGCRHPDPCLVGLFTEFHRNQKTMIATRVQSILRAVSQRLLE